MHPESKATLLTLNPQEKSMFVYVGTAGVRDAVLLRLALDEALRVLTVGGEDESGAGKGGEALCLN